MEIVSGLNFTSVNLFITLVSPYLEVKLFCVLSFLPFNYIVDCVC